MITFNNSTVNQMTVKEFNIQKRRESKSDALHIRVEPIVRMCLEDINQSLYPDLDFPAFIRQVLSDYTRGRLPDLAGGDAWQHT